MVYMASGRTGLVWLGGALIVVGFVLAYALHIGVVPVRVDMWRSPWSNTHANGMQLGQALWGLASGGVAGSGLGLGATSAVPRARDDLVFAAIGEDLGLVGALAVAVLFAVIAARG